MNSASFRAGGVTALKDTELKSGIPMNEHLQRALIEVYYAMAEFNQSHATAQSETDSDEARARLVIVRANLEQLLRLPDRAVEIKWRA